MSVDPPSERNIAQPNDDDVLLGRGAACWNHPGNRRFREIVSSHLKDYERAKARIEKMVIVADIVKKITEAGGRFLKKDERSDTWYTVDRKAAIEKVGHAIRDKRAMVTKKLERDRMQQQIEDQHRSHLGLMHGSAATMMAGRNMAHLGADPRIGLPQHTPMPPLSGPLGGVAGWPAPAFLGGAAGTGMQGIPPAGMHGMGPVDEPAMQQMGAMSFGPGGPPMGMDPTMGGGQQPDSRRMQHRILMEKSARDLKTKDALNELRRTEIALETVRQKAEAAKQALKKLERGDDITDIAPSIDPSGTGYSPSGSMKPMYPGPMEMSAQSMGGPPMMQQPQHYMGVPGVQHQSQGAMNPMGMMGSSQQGGGYSDYLRRTHGGVSGVQQQQAFGQQQQQQPDSRPPSEADIKAALGVLQAALREGNEDTIRRASLASGLPPDRLLNAYTTGVGRTSPSSAGAGGNGGGMGYASAASGGGATGGSSGQEQQQWKQQQQQYPPPQQGGEGGAGFDNNMSNQGGR